MTTKLTSTQRTALAFVVARYDGVSTEVRYAWFGRSYYPGTRVINTLHNMGMLTRERVESASGMSSWYEMKEAPTEAGRFALVRM